MTPHRATLAAAPALVLALALSACGGQPTSGATPAPTVSTTAPPKASPTPGDGTFPTPENAETTDVDSVAETTAKIANSYDTTTDTTETAALLRAKPLMTTKYAETLAEPQRNGNQAEWLVPAEHDAYSSPSLQPAASDVTAHDYGPNRAARAYTVTWKWQGRDGEILDSNTRRNVVVYLEKHAGRWQVVGYTTEDLG